jgi:hypothetical protein
MIYKCEQYTGSTIKFKYNFSNVINSKDNISHFVLFLKIFDYQNLHQFQLLIYMVGCYLNHYQNYH